MHQAEANHNGALRSLSRAGKGGGIGRKETRCYRKTKRARAPLSAIARRKKRRGRGTRTPSPSEARARAPAVGAEAGKGRRGEQGSGAQNAERAQGEKQREPCAKTERFCKRNNEARGDARAHPRERARRAQKRVPFRLPKPAGAESALTPDKSAGALKKRGGALRALAKQQPCARAYRESFERSAKPPSEKQVAFKCAPSPQRYSQVDAGIRGRVHNEKGTATHLLQPRSA